MAWGEWSLKRLSVWTPGEEAAIRSFLSSGGLGFDAQKPDLLVIACNARGDIIGTGALAGNVLKQILVSDEYRGSGLFSDIVGALMEEAAGRGLFHLFVFTKPQAVHLFKGLGFNLIVETELAALLEYGRPNLEDYLQRLGQERRPIPEPGPGHKQGSSAGPAPEPEPVSKAKIPKVAGIVVNCNPFTLGHRYLIETASLESSEVHIFVVTEDRSLFPTKVRLHLVKEGTKDLENVVVHEAGPYIISAATFPNYFLRCPGEATRAQAELDATVFGKHIAPVFGINTRFVGEEPLDATTSQYNEALSRVLPRYGISVRIVPRLTKDGAPVSASSVRKAIQKGDWEHVSRLVPKTTLDFLKSSDAEGIIERIRASGSRPH
ncbi:MAG: [citrate (pro-3S)-lyase] ligase [Candidatus Fermentithermobacillus carboniphilus]|uniref:[Citrate [pro-3S]-lyase] ligase n=1 Tax=Candidatus Fermentithermobacillus carboniphilus TaxID=3085328 RepID=A0AAT9LAS9_9FIRM|nr:MAG: [citrate (pro-3S)-lyase] ligase [Candidatus Fermentithermobacillus carboniphilus]